MRPVRYEITQVLIYDGALYKSNPNIMAQCVDVLLNWQPVLSVQDRVVQEIE